jgi:hypothetical protein
MIEDNGVICLDQPDEIDHYLKSTGNFVRFGELKQVMRDNDRTAGIATLRDEKYHSFLLVGGSPEVAILLIDASLMPHAMALHAINGATALATGKPVDIKVRDTKSYNN